MVLLQHHLETYEFDSLQAAMTFAKELNAFVTIQFDGLEVVGVFGAAGIINGKCPDGIDYSWKKRRR